MRRHRGYDSAAVDSGSTTTTAAAHRRAAGILVATRQSRLLFLPASSYRYESGDLVAARDEAILEGPDAAIVGIAAHPAPFAHLLAVAVASGCVQLEDTGGYRNS